MEGDDEAALRELGLAADAVPNDGDVGLYISFFFSSRRRHTRYIGDWSSDVCSSDLRSSEPPVAGQAAATSCVYRKPRRTLALRRQPYRAAYRSLARLSCTRILLPARA